MQKHAIVCLESSVDSYLFSCIVSVGRYGWSPVHVLWQSSICSSRTCSRQGVHRCWGM